MIYVGPAPSAAFTYRGQTSLLFVQSKDWTPLRVPGDLSKQPLLTTGTLMYEIDPTHEPHARMTSFVAAAPMTNDAVRQRQGKSPLGSVLLAHVVSPQEGMAALDAARRELGDEGYSWGLRVFGHTAELAECAKKSPDCLYELVTSNIENGKSADAADLLALNVARFDSLASTLHDTQERYTTPVKTARGAAEPATGLSWASLLRVILLEQSGRKQKADLERAELARRAPRYEESIKERYYEGWAPLDHFLFKHDRPRVLYARASDSKSPNP